MKRSNSKSKAFGAFKKLGAVALITATMCFTACKQTNGGGGGEKPAPTPKHAITFSVDSTTPNGTLKAKADGVDETSTSPITVEEGKTVTFTAEPSANYKVKEWKVGDIVVTGNKTNTYTHTVTKAVTVKVSFESNSTPTPTKYTVTLNKTEHGKVTASPEIPADKQVAKDTEITFTATANAGYKVGKWTVTGSVLEANTGADGSETAKVKITANTTVSVSFEANSNPPTPQGTAILTLDPNKLTIRVMAKTEDGSDIAVEGCNETTLRSDKYTELQAKGTVVILKGKITELICSRNQLTALNVQGLTALQGLHCSYNQLTALDVSGCTTLKELYCQNNRLTSLNVQGLTALHALDCNNNELHELGVQGLTSLQYLGCNWNKLTALNVQDLTALRELSCESNQLSALNVQGLTALRKFYCYGNQLNAKWMTKLLNALPTRDSGDNARAVLYTEKKGVSEGNCKDFTQPEDLKKAFDGAKKRGWTLKKLDAYGNDVVL